MITGDNYLTACQVAKDLGMIDRPMLVLQENGSWLGLDDDVTHNENLRDLLQNYDFCITGNSFPAFISDLNKANYVSHVKVFARVSPDQKEKILSTLKNLGKTTLMCGDGTNDVGALKQAHIGVALLNQPAGVTPKPVTTPIPTALRTDSLRVQVPPLQQCANPVA
jgi:cation-transporting ATPase 13A1